MARRRAKAARPRARAWRLLDGRGVDLRGLTARERAFLADLQKMARAKISFFEIERAALGPGSPALGGRNRLDPRTAATALYLVAEDIATRAGMDQGLVLAPEHQAKLDTAPSNVSMISVAQAAELIGMSRTAVYKAVEKGTLRAQRIGNVTIVDRGSAQRYAQRRSAGWAIASLPAVEGTLAAEDDGGRRRSSRKSSSTRGSPLRQSTRQPKASWCR